MKILNLYAGIGGNRKNWGDEHEITAIEYKPEIAAIYQDFFPNDKVVVADAHKYLLEHFAEFDFIWSSPPCPSHSKLRKQLSMSVGAKAIYPDMKLYEEILFLQGYFKGNWVIENVIGWYEPLIKPQLLQRHYFWSNLKLYSDKFGEVKTFKNDKINITGGRNIKESVAIKQLQKNHNINLDKYKTSKKKLMLRNCVNPELGLHILNCALDFNKHKTLF